MKRHPWFGAGLLLPLMFTADVYGHDDHHGHHGGSDYYAVIDDFHANPSTTDATGEIFLTLSHERTELGYTIVLDDLLGLKENPEDRTQPDDIIGIHLHLDVPGAVGPHLLNIFGLATYGMPAEEDADLVIDYEHRILSGIYDISDATRDPVTGEPLPQFFPLTSKIIYDWLDELDAGELMVAVHTVESGFPAMAIHGHIHPVAPVPESTTNLLLLGGVWWGYLNVRRKRLAATRI
jgi:hypothetical protein